MDVPRISPQETRRRLASDVGTLLVCAYDTNERFQGMKLEGAVSWPECASRLPSLSKDRAIILYCA